MHRTTTPSPRLVQRANKVCTYLILSAPALALILFPSIAKILIPLLQPAQNKMSCYGRTSQHLAELIQEVNTHAL